MARSDLESIVDGLGAALREERDVRLAFLFGSRAVRRAREGSDYDVAVLVDDETARADRGATVRRLAGRLGREVSSVLLDIVILNGAPALLRQRVLRDGIVLYQRSPEERVRFAVSTIRDYQDGQIRREQATRARIERLKTGIDDGGPRDLLEKARGVGRLLEKASRVP